MGWINIGLFLGILLLTGEDQLGSLVIGGLCMFVGSVYEESV